MDGFSQEIETWVQALGHYDNNEFEEALKTFGGIPDTSKILFNCGVIHATLGEHEKAVSSFENGVLGMVRDLTRRKVECYQRAVRMDSYLAVAYFQQGISNFLVGDFEEALVNFNDTLKKLRGNTFIDYDQLGLKFKLYSCEVMFNRGLCYIYMSQIATGLADLTHAAMEKVTPDHDVIDEAIREEAEVGAGPTSARGEVLTGQTGLYGLLHPRRRGIPAQQLESEEPQDQRLSGKGSTDRRG